MKRTSLVLDRALLEEAQRLSGENTYSKTVDRALAEYVRRARAGRIHELAGSGLWEGDRRNARRPPAAAIPRGSFRHRPRIWLTPQSGSRHSASRPVEQA